MEAPATATAPPATSGRTYLRWVGIDGMEYLARVPITHGLPDSEDDFFHPRVPAVPEFNSLFFGTDASAGEQRQHEEHGYRRRKRSRVPASSRAILGLRELSACETTRAECAVCLQDFGAEDKLREMPCSCSHVFHQDCIFEWLRRNRVCPLCRHALPTQEQEEEEEDGGVHQHADVRDLELKIVLDGSETYTASEVFFF